VVEGLGGEQQLARHLGDDVNGAYQVEYLTVTRGDRAAAGLRPDGESFSSVPGGVA
jgi:hypothetical protein